MLMGLKKRLNNVRLSCMHSQSHLFEKTWDYIIVGTGMGGGPIGLRLAQAGFSVLFLEKGRSPQDLGALTGAFAELSMNSDNEAEILEISGRLSQSIYDASSSNLRKTLPFIGQGVGGSSALYGMVLERFAASDFKSWPLDYKNFEEFYEQAESLFAVRKNRSIRHPAFQKLHDDLQKQGLHPYVLPLANNNDFDCTTCQSFLCEKSCKHDSGKMCIEPAIKLHDASLLTECEVIKIETDKNKAVAVSVRVGEVEKSIKGSNIILAAGALVSPLLLMNSVSKDFPNGLGNRSNLVGHYLMRHYVDLYALKIDSDPQNNSVKEIGFNDFYERKGIPLGTVQSFGRLPPVDVILYQLEASLKYLKYLPIGFLFRIARPVISWVLNWLTQDRLVMASIIEDTPQFDNKVWSSHGKTFFNFKMPSVDIKKVKYSRKILKKIFKPFGLWFIACSEKNEMLAHACGTCKMGIDPLGSVVDTENRVHGIDNLYVVDSSFFPTSGGTNPALTIAANSLRVADILLTRGK